MKKLIRISTKELKEITLDEAYELFYKLACKEANKYKNSNIEYDDLIQTSYIGLIKAYNTYKKLDICFSTYMLTVVRNEILMLLRKKQLKTESLDGEIEVNKGDFVTKYEVIPDAKDCIKEKEDRMLLEEIYNNASDLEKIIIEALANGKTQQTIANEVGFSRGYISRIIKKIGVDFNRLNKGVYSVGRKPKANIENIKAYQQKGMTINEIANKLGVSRITVYNQLKKDVSKNKEIKPITEATEVQESQIKIISAVIEIEGKQYNIEDKAIVIGSRNIKTKEDIKIYKHYKLKELEEEIKNLNFILNKIGG